MGVLVKQAEFCCQWPVVGILAFSTVASLRSEIQRTTRDESTQDIRSRYTVKVLIDKRTG